MRTFKIVLPFPDFLHTSFPTPNLLITIPLWGERKLAEFQANKALKRRPLQTGLSNTATQLRVSHISRFHLPLIFPRRKYLGRKQGAESRRHIQPMKNSCIQLFILERRSAWGLPLKSFNFSCGSSLRGFRYPMGSWMKKKGKVKVVFLGFWKLSLWNIRL